MAQENTARVITIAATEQPQDIRLRVAAYARVSSSSDEQLNSFAAQNRYYTELISSKHFRLVNGSNIAVAYSFPVHYQDEKGKYKEIDNNRHIRPQASGVPAYDPPV